jgi:hypothetical protein
MSCSVINKLTILDKNGNPKRVENRSDSHIQGNVELVGGSGFDIEWDEDTKEITLSVGDSLRVGGEEYQQKWLDIVNGNNGYSGVPYYISRVNRIEPAEDGTLFVLGDVCSQIGLFPSGSAPASSANSLEVFDMCEACIDCEEYAEIYYYLEIIDAWLENHKNKNIYYEDEMPLIADVDRSGDTNAINLLRQYESTVRYWNYLVHMKGTSFSAGGLGLMPSCQVGFRCEDCGPFNVTIDVSMNMLSGPAEQRAERTIAAIGTSFKPDRFKPTANFQVTSRLSAQIGIQGIVKGQEVRYDVAAKWTGEPGEGDKAPEGTEIVWEIVVTWSGGPFSTPIVKREIVRT